MHSASACLAVLLRPDSWRWRAVPHHGCVRLSLPPAVPAWLVQATLMRRLQSRLLQAGADDLAVGSPPGKARPPDEQQGQQQQWRPPPAQQEQEQQQQLGGFPSLAINEAAAPEHLPPATAAAAQRRHGSPPMQGEDFGATGMQPACATPAGQGQPQHRHLQELPDGGSCAMQISPAAGALRRL